MVLPQERHRGHAHRLLAAFEERALDAGEAELPEREREGEAVEDGEPPFLIDQPDAGARERVARVAAELVRAAEDGAAGDGAVAVEAEQSDRVRAEQGGAEIAPVVAEDDVVLGRDAARHLTAADLAGQRAIEAGDEASREVEPFAVDGPRGQPERVVLDVGEIVGREEAFAREVTHVRPGVRPQEAPAEGILDVDAIAALEPEPQLEAAELGERIAREEVASVGLLLVDVEHDVAEQPFEAEDPGAEVQSVREVQVQEVAAEVVDDLAEVLRLCGGHAEEEDVVPQHVAGEQLCTLCRTDAGGDDRVAAREVDGELAPLVVGRGARAREDGCLEIGPRPAHGQRIGIGRAIADDEAGCGRVGERDGGERCRVGREIVPVDPEHSLAEAGEHEPVAIRQPLRVEGAAGHGRELAAVAGDVDGVDVEDAAPVGAEQDARAVRRPARGQIVPGAVRDVAHVPGLDVDAEEVRVPIRAEAGPVRGEDDGAAIGGPVGVPIAVVVVGEGAQLLGPEVDDVEVGESG